MYHNVLHVFHDVLLCLTMFYDVQRIAQPAASPHQRQSIASGIATMPQGSLQRLRDRYNDAVIGINSAEIGDGAAGIVDIAANVIPC